MGRGIRKCEKLFDKNALKTGIKKKFSTDEGTCLGMIGIKIEFDYYLYEKMPPFKPNAFLGC